MTSTIEFLEFDITKPDPSGNRANHLASGFVKILSTGSGEFLDFGSVTLVQGIESGISQTQVVIFRATQITGVISNMKFWLPVSSDLSGFPFRVLGNFNGNFIQNSGMSIFRDTNISGILPNTQNVFRGDGSTTIIGTGENQCSQYIYLSVFASGASIIPEGAYGGHTNGFQFRLTYDES